MAAQTIVERFWERASSHPDAVALCHKSDGNWNRMTWGEYGSAVRRAAKTLLSLGFRHSDKLSILSSNRPEWFIGDLACMSMGGTTCPIYVTSSSEQVAHVVGHSESKIAIVEDTEQLDKILKRRDRLPALERVVVIEGYNGDANPGLVSTWEEWLGAGAALEESRVDDAFANVRPEDIATFVYTSGTTGTPKAVMLSHANIWWAVTHSEQRIPITGGNEARALSYLPLSHIAERMISHFLQIYYGSQTWFAESTHTLLADLLACRPTYFFGVPRVWEKFHGRLQERLEAEPETKKERLELALLKRALHVGSKVVRAEQEAVARGGKLRDARLPLGVKLERIAHERTVLAKLRQRVGLDACGLMVSAAAPMEAELLWFFHALGMRIAEGYGQSEDCGPTAWNPPDAIRIGTVGTPLPGLELNLAEDGEVLVRAGSVTPGYYKDEQATRELIDEQGWMRTGDIGELDDRGYLKITDRKKDLIVTAGGKNVAPQAIESKIKVHPLVSQVVVLGDGRPYLTAIVTLEEDKASSWAREHGIEGNVGAIARDERTLKEIEAAVGEVNDSVAQPERIKKFRLLERDFSQEANEITPTLKVKRKEISAAYAPVIDEMYARDSPATGAATPPGA